MLYRTRPEESGQSHSGALAERPDSLLFRPWQVRLEYVQEKYPGWLTDFAIMLLLCLAGGCLLKLPGWTVVGEEYFLVRYGVLTPVAAMLVHSLKMRAWPGPASLMTPPRRHGAQTGKLSACLRHPGGRSDFHAALDIQLLTAQFRRIFSYRGSASYTINPVGIIFAKKSSYAHSCRNHSGRARGVRNAASHHQPKS